MKKIIFFAILMGVLSMASFAENPLLNEITEQWARFTKESPQERIYLQFDKPFYKPGDTIWFQVYLRNANNFTASETSDIVHIEWISPKGSIDQHLRLITKNGVTSGDLAIDDNANGGLYKIKAYTTWQKNEPTTLLFEKETKTFIRWRRYWRRTKERMVKPGCVRNSVGRGAPSTAATKTKRRSSRL